MGQVAVIIPNWNGFEDTIECLESLVSTTTKLNPLLIVVDNASTNNSVQELLSWGLRNIPHDRQMHLKHNDTIRFQLSESMNFVLVEAGKNNGYGAAINEGLKLIMHDDGVEFVWVLNNDTTVSEYALERLVDFCDKTPGYGMIGSTICHYSQPDLLQCAGGFNFYRPLGLGRPVLSNMHMDTISRVDSITIGLDFISGASMFITKGALLSVGLFNEGYFLYYEELDYTYRMRKLGFKTAWCKGSVIYHKGGSTTGANRNNGNRSSFISEYYSTLSLLKFAKRYLPYSFVITFTLRFILKSILYVKNGEYNWFSALIKAYRDYFIWSRGEGTQLASTDN